MDVITPSPFEKHYTPKELAEVWQLDETTIRRIFDGRPDVFKIINKKRGKRAYGTLRIPESTVQRVYQERSR